MSSGALRCSGCGSSSFSVDEVSGRYICTSCWQVSDSLRGITHDHKFGETAYGLRAVNTSSSVPQRDDLMYCSVPSEGQIKDASQAFDDFVPASPITKRRRKEREGDTADHAATVMSTKGAPKETHKKRSRLRSWRMSEAFTLLLHHQMTVFTRAYLTPEPTSFPGVVDRFNSIANTLWTNYLGATGELGGDMWALSFRRTLKALESIFESRKNYLRHCNAEGRSAYNQALPRVGRKGEKDSRWLTRFLESKLGFGFCWIGWGSLYCPNETESANNPFFLFETNCDHENQSSVSCADDDDCESSITLGSSDSESVDETPPQKRPRRLVPSPQSLSAQHLPEEQAGLSSNVQSLLEMWKQMLVENLIKRQPKKDMFWHGKLGKHRTNWLLEYNLGVLFLAAFLTLTAVNTRKVAICQHDFFTLHDLSCLCQDRDKFPYLLADRWVSNHFASFNTSMPGIFKRPLIPDPLILTRVIIHLINMLGITERPRLPLCSLVHRLLRQMSFPPEAHQMADSLVAKLARCVKDNVGEKRVGMHYFLPLHRYLRGEVFAMAIVAITGRLLFKLDGDFEHRWSKVARFLTQHPEKAALLKEVLNDEDAKAETRGLTVHFDWSSWMCGLPSDSPSLRRPRSRFRTGSAPLNTVLTHSQLVRTARSTKEFLGAASSFNPQVDEGWGENYDCPRHYNLKETKLSLTDCLTQLIGHSCFATNGDNAGTSRQDAKVQSIPCKSCVHTINHTIFRRATNQAVNDKWVDQNCDALVRAHRFIRQRNIPASELLNKIHPFTSKPDDIYTAWLHVLENFDSYNPISGADFPTDLEKASSSNIFPPLVMDFIGDHEKRVFDFFSGNRVDPSSGTNGSAVPLKSGKKAGNLAKASLHWFLKSASTMCGARLSQLLREIECIEHLLGCWPGEELSVLTKLRNLALAFHFDYSVPE